MNKIKALRKERKLSQKELADILGVNQTAVSQWEREVTTPNPSTLKKLSELFNVSLDYILGNAAPAPSHKKGVKIPVLGYVAAGIPIEAVEDIVDWEEIPEEMSRKGDYFGLIIKGNSMEPRICKNDVVIVRKQPDVESGEIAIVLVNGDSGTCKKVIKHTNGISLISFNPSYEPLFFTNEEIISSPLIILGKVVELRGKF